ncbi:MAG: cytochrome c oxidase subunit II [Alphaproteobacteria bacterium]|nr:cytochrome c oxidase subunit II [Alphaproteobacteria bacterium]MDE2340364.1 cytochrome c oxidase subunit II [Alphaproteobacteria bacterium]
MKRVVKQISALALTFTALVFAPALVAAKAPDAAPAVAATVPAAAPADMTPPADPANLTPTPGVGQPTSDFWGSIQLQPQVTTNGKFAAWMESSFLMPLITVISLFVLFLLLWVMARYNRRANPTPAKTSHNTLIEIIWTAVPAIVLMGVFLPSFKLLRDQYAASYGDGVVLKATGHQWYWTYKYPDNGDFEITSKILPDADAAQRGDPRNLGVDNRILVPVNTPIKLLTTSDDVIHSWAVPALWTKMDAVPGKINEAGFTINRIGVYYGQCSELCGALHGFMPIAIEAVSKERFNQWIAAHGGHAKGVNLAPAADAAGNSAAPSIDANAAAPAATTNIASK